MTASAVFYSLQHTFFVAVDCIIFGFKDNEMLLLCHKRAMEPAFGGLSLMGGFVKENQSVNEAAISVLSNLTGLENIFMEQVGVYGEIDRDPGERVISCAFYALIDICEHNEALLESHNAFWININQASDLIFDHYQMVQDALSILRRKAAVQPIGFNLLPEKFTLTQLQALYEAIYGHPFDKRNFRKKMMNMNFLEKTNEIDKSGSKKGAYYYKFKYDREEI
ncbi:Hydrolase, NUDIX family [uncultured Paludibacter sp.]|uniref:Hydrolase, NUDIX family n=1 Tax=uncultured Paludibacter sp. TaxID=497635 RepID=A0A653AHS6_9BACT|nr:Hydrolase, NUDIX family [uncultured Paludibacter sp.]